MKRLGFLLLILVSVTSCAETRPIPSVPPVPAPMSVEVELPTSEDPASWDRKWAEELAKVLRQNAQSVATTSPSTIPQVQSTWSGEKARVAVMEFEDKTGTVYQTTSTSRGYAVGAPVGRGMKEQLVTALMETGAFTVLLSAALKAKPIKGPIPLRQKRIG
jgi:hypothetical protein